MQPIVDTIIHYHTTYRKPDQVKPFCFLYTSACILRTIFLQLFISICTLLAFMMVLWYSSQKMTQSKRGI